MDVSPLKGTKAQGLRGSSDQEGECRLHLSLAWQMLGPTSQGLLQPALPSTAIPAFDLGPSYIP